MRSTGIPTPDDLTLRFRHSREELAQRAVASLVLGREPAKWNRAETPTSRGLAFLRALDPFGEVGDDDVAFVDEFELPARHDAERAGWPDWAVLQPGRVLLIELKTERGSHRARQREHYLDLGRHHHPADQVDLIYVTPPMTLTHPGALPDRSRYAHLDWKPIADLVATTWGDTADPMEVALAEFTVTFLRTLDRPPEPRPATTPSPAEPSVSTTPGALEITDALGIAEMVEQDRTQRAVPLNVVDPAELEDARLQLREALPTTAPHVKVWLWRAATSGGRALTDLGQEQGYELRLSYYASKPSE